MSGDGETIRDLAQPLLDSLASAIGDIAARHLTPPAAPDGLIALHREVLALMERVNARLIGAQQAIAPPDKRTLACAKGCAWCCHLLVTAPAPTLFALARRTRAEADAARMAEILSIGAHGHEDVMRFDGPPGWPLRCIMLGSDNACTVYEDRPATCRSHNSIDESACAARYHDMSVSVHGFEMPGVAERAMQDALARAFDAAGYRKGAVAIDLKTGLHLVLTTENAETRWLEGEDLFAPVRLDVARGEFGARLRPLLETPPFRA